MGKSRGGVENENYDSADRLTSTSPSSGAITYDAHGNTTIFGPQRLSFGSSKRHLQSTSGPTVVRYARDATGRIVSRTEGLTVTRYGHAGPGDSPAFTMNSLNLVLEVDVPLAGGAVLTKRLLGLVDVWSYPNVHGDVVASATFALGALLPVPLGVKRALYDPFGQPLARTPAGAPAGTDGVPDNSDGNMDSHGWLGQSQRPFEHAPGLATVEMGARPYVPSLGRFLASDPVEGGSCSAYEYTCGDPVNGSDLTGTRTRNPEETDLYNRCNGLTEYNEDFIFSDGCERFRRYDVTGDVGYLTTGNPTGYGKIVSRNPGFCVP